MVQAVCTPNSHVGDFDFDCSNVDCRSGPNGKRSTLCEYCKIIDFSNRTLMHCSTCHILFLENKKQEEEKKDDESD